MIVVDKFDGSTTPIADWIQSNWLPLLLFLQSIRENAVRKTLKKRGKERNNNKQLEINACNHIYTYTFICIQINAN